MPDLKSALLTAASLCAVLLGFTVLRGGVLGLFCVLIGAVGLGKLFLEKIYPWTGARCRLRLLYHSPEVSSIEAGTTLAKALCSVAAAAERTVSLVVCVHEGELTAYVECAEGSVAPLSKVLGYLLPDARLEEDAALPTLPVARKLRRVGRRPGPTSVTFDMNKLAAAGDSEIRCYFSGRASGATIWAPSRPEPKDFLSRVRWTAELVWRRLMRVIGAEPFIYMGKAWAFRHYGRLEGFGAEPCLILPSTTGRASLDSNAGQNPELPSWYKEPQLEGSLTMGYSVNGERIGLPAGNWGGALYALGKGNEPLDYVLSQLGRLGAGLVWLGAEASLPPQEHGPTYILDTNNPAQSLHLDLLAGRQSTVKLSPAETTSEITQTLEQRIGALSDFLGFIGLPTWNREIGSEMLLDWARVQTLRYYRSMLDQDGLPAHAPTLPSLIGELKDPEALGSLAHIEAREWTVPGTVVSRELSKAGSSGEKAQHLAMRALSGVIERLNASSPGARNMITVRLMSQLASKLDAPMLARDWKDNLDVYSLFNTAPAPQIAVRGGNAALGGMLLAGLLSAARSRTTRSKRKTEAPGYNPLVVVLEGEWVDRAAPLFSGQLKLLSAAGICLLCSSEKMPVTEPGRRLLDEAIGWWLTDLHPSDLIRIRAKLEEYSDLVLDRIPEGSAVVKLDAERGTLVIPASFQEPEASGEVPESEVNDAA